MVSFNHQLDTIWNHVRRVSVKDCLERVGLWGCLRGFIAAVVIDGWRPHLTVGSTLRLLWVLSCVCTEKASWTVSMLVCILSARDCGWEQLLQVPAWTSVQCWNSVTRNPEPKHLSLLKLLLPGALSQPQKGRQDTSLLANLQHNDSPEWHTGCSWWTHTDTIVSQVQRRH